MAQPMPAMQTSEPHFSTLRSFIPQSLTTVLSVQGVYYLVTGIWPLISMETFQMVTGKKTDNLVTGLENDHWLVMTVGVLVTAIGACLLVAAVRRQCTLEIAVLAVLSAMGLLGIDIVYVTRKTIPPIYLLDAGMEIFVILGWIYAGSRQQGDPAFRQI